MRNTNVVIFSQMKRLFSILSSIFIVITPAFADGYAIKTVVIDAGHGGKDPGCVSKDRKLYEKTVTLDIACRLRDKIREAYPDVKVVLTRDSDKFVELGDRAAIANKANANLFISIHINAARSTSANGYSTHVLGQSTKKNRDLFAYNMDVVQRENAVMMLEDDYTTKYADFDPEDTKSFIFLQLMQNANLEQSLDFAQMVMNNLKGGPVKVDRGIWQDPFYVLWKTSMPAVLVELGFISNAEEAQALKQSENRNRLAGILFKSFQEYKAKYEGSVDVTPTAVPADAGQKVPEPEKATEPQTRAESQANAEPKEIETPAVNSDIRYGIQIFASSRDLKSNDPIFLGYEPEVFGDEVKKYVICSDPSLPAVRKKLVEIKKKYKDAFVVRIEGKNLYIEKKEI